MFANRSLQVFLTLTALLTAIVGTAAAGSTVELRMASLAPAGSQRLAYLAKSAAELDKKSAGRVKLKYYASGVQGDERDLFRKLNLAQLDGAELSSLGLSLIEESIRVLELPGLLATVEELDYVADKIWPYFQAKFSKRGFVLAGRGDVGSVQLMSKNELRSTADFKAAAAWLLPEDSILKDLYKKLGVKGIALAAPGVEPALSAGSINAVYGSPLTAVSLNWHTKVRYISSVSLGHAITATVLEEDAFKKLSADDQALVSNNLRVTSAKLRSLVRGETTSARAQLEKSGVTTSQSPSEFVAALDKAAQETWTDLTGKVFYKADLDLVLKYRGEYRAKNAGK